MDEWISVDVDVGADADVDESSDKHWTYPLLLLNNVLCWTKGMSYGEDCSTHVLVDKAWGRFRWIFCKPFRKNLTSPRPSFFALSFNIYKKGVY